MSERKFMVQKLPGDLDQFSRKEIRQGYLAVTRNGTEARIRRAGAKCSLTIRQAAGNPKVQEEIRISERQFASLWPLTRKTRAEKVRYQITRGEVTIVLDVYDGRLKGLATARLKFPSEEASNAFRPFSWLGAEITDDERYKNRNLAFRGIPKGSTPLQPDLSVN